MCANGHVFDKLELPMGFEKKYLEWIVPDFDENIEDYSRRMAREIDTSMPFVLVGYSFGGVIIQEMNKFLTPIKNIIIASVKDYSEFPPLLRFARKIKFAERFPWWSLADNKAVKELLSKFVYRIRNIDMDTYVTQTHPYYMQWAISNMLNWEASITCPNFYRIHGTRDITFPHKYIKEAEFFKGGDHLMVLKHPAKVSALLSRMLME